MEIPEPVEPKEISVLKNQPKKNLSDSDIYSRQLSITSDADVDENLHIIGFKVRVGSDAYSFQLGKATHNKSADVLTIVADSKQLQLSSIDPGEDFVDQMQSEASFIEADSENESLHSGSDTEEQIPAFPKENPQASCSKESSTQPQEALTKNIAEGILSSTARTDPEFESSSVQTSRVEAQQPRSTQTTVIQTDRTQNVSTTTSKVETDSVKVQTDGIWKKQAAIQTDIGKMSSFAQTETVAIHSTGTVHDASTENDKREEKGTSTNFDVYVIDGENLMEKSVDTEDLPFTPLIVAKREDAVIAIERSSDCKDCNCFCGHRNHHRCIYKCCIHNDYKNLKPGSIHCKNNHIAKFSNGSLGCNYCHCRSRNCCNETNTCNSMFRMDLHQSHCCKCGNFQTKGVQSKTTTNVETKSLKLPESIKTSKMRFVSLAQQGKISNRDEVEAAKNLENGLEKNKIIIAARIFKCRNVERVRVLKIPVVFEHFLKSFNLSLYESFRIVVNPIKISLTLDEKVMFRKEKDSKSNKTSFKEKFTRGQRNIVVSCDDAKRMPLSCAPEVKIAVDDERSQICPCSKSNSNNQSVSEVKGFSHLVDKKGNLIKDNNAKTSKNYGRSTSPKIKHRGFDYIAKDKWKPHHPARDDVVIEKLESTHITFYDQSSSEECFERVKNMFLKDACETVNDHLLSLRFVDENRIRAAAEILHKQWFEVAGTKQSDVRQVRYYIQYFEEFSNNLLRTLLYSVDNNGNNVLHFAFANNRFDLVEEFLKNGFAVNLLNKTNKIGNTPIMICSISQPKNNSEWSTVCKAFQMGDINAKSKKSGQTALMNAASSGFYTMVNKLLDLGANPNVQDKDGSTALMYAAEHGHEKCIKALIKHKKCDPTIQDKDGQTACSIALCNNHKNIAVLIHMKALEKRRFSKNLYASQRYIWTNNVKASRMKALSMMTRSLR